MKFNKYLKTLMREKNLSKAELGRRVRKTQPYIYHLCRGTKPAPTPEVMSSIAKALDVTKSKTQKLMDFSFQRILGKYTKFLHLSSYGKVAKNKKRY